MIRKEMAMHDITSQIDGLEQAKRLRQERNAFGMSTIALSTVSFLLFVSMWLVALTPVSAAPVAPGKAGVAKTLIYTHTATATNSTGDWTNLDNVVTNGNPNAIVFATPNWNPTGAGGVYDNHAIGVWYTGSRWAIFNQDLTPIPSGASFNVYAFSSSKDPHIFVHKAATANSSGDWTALNNSLANNNPNAIVLATPNWNPGGTGGVYDNHAIGVWYTGSKWAVFNQDLTAIPNGASFNVLVFKDSSDWDFVHRATTANSTGDWTNIASGNADGNPDAIVFAISNWNPGGTGGVYNKHNIGVWYTGSKWAVFNQDVAAIPNGASFNIITFF